MITVTYVGPTVITVTGPKNGVTSKYPITATFAYKEADGTVHLVNTSGTVDYNADDSDYKTVADAAMAANNLTY